MSCLIVLDDGRACAPAMDAFEAMINAIADHLPQAGEDQQLAAWLRQQVGEMRLVGHSRIDIRELTPENRHRFRKAVERVAYHLGCTQPADGTAVAVPSWVKRLGRLLRMMHSIDRGESPDAISDVPSPVAPTGLVRGPGWRLAV